VKSSQYNFIWSSGLKDKVIVYNCLSGALVEVDHKYLELLENGEFDYGALSDDVRRFVNDMAKGSFIIDNDINELKLLKFRHNHDKYSRTRMNLIIAPTLACNFACPYCYEQVEDGVPTTTTAVMQEATQEAILRFITQSANIIKHLNITWYGGEPLLVQDIVFAMSKKMGQITAKHGIAYSANMITNGYLFHKIRNVVHHLKDSQIGAVQISLDGPPAVHDQRRVLKADHETTFAQILENIKMLLVNGIKIYVRINVDQANMASVDELLTILETIKTENLHLYLGHIKPYTAGCKSVESACVVMDEFADFEWEFQEKLRQRGFNYDKGRNYPRPRSIVCEASHVNSFVIDPDGDMYKCYAEIGDKTASIANVMDFDQPRDKKKRMHEIHLLTWDPFEFEDCINCKVLPVCAGGCPHLGIFRNKNKPECDKSKYNIEKLVKTRYRLEKATFA